MIDWLKLKSFTNEPPPDYPTAVPKLPRTLTAPEQPQIGKWIIKPALTCSRCGYKLQTVTTPNRCPNCHASMQPF